MNERGHYGYSNGYNRPYVGAEPAPPAEPSDRHKAIVNAVGLGATLLFVFGIPLLMFTKEDRAAKREHGAWK
jgi:hypothetical protein